MGVGFLFKNKLGIDCLKNGQITNDRLKCCSGTIAEAPMSKNNLGDDIFIVTRCAPHLPSGMLY